MSSGILLRRVLEIGVLDDDQIAGHLGEPAAERRPLAPVLRLQDQLEPALLLQPRQDVPRPSFDPSSTTMSSMRTGTASTRRTISSIVASLVVDGHHDREERVGQRATDSGHQRPIEK